ncbi:MAG TPA: hypothetical protein VIY26_12355, partial [Acidimicrobiales bacterium]
GGSWWAQRRRRIRVRRVAALALSAATWLGVAALPAAAAAPGQCGACQGGGPIAALEGRIAAFEHPTLCQVSDVSPENQGGSSTIEIMSFSSTKRCDPRSTAGQGTLYLVASQSPSAARYLLALAGVTPSFVDGWRSGKVAVLLGRGTSILHQLQVFQALKGHSRFVFGGHNAS